MPNIRSSYDDVQLCHLTNIPTNWILVPAEGAATGLGGASELHRRVESAPDESHAAIKLLTGDPEYHPNCISVVMAISDRQFASFLEAFKVVFCTPDARYLFQLGDFYGFEDAAEGSDSAMTAAQLLAGKPLIISPATVSMQVRPPKRRKSRDGSQA